MDRQKLSRMMDRSERMYLWNKGRRQQKAESVAIDLSTVCVGGLKPNPSRLLHLERNYLHSTA